VPFGVAPRSIPITSRPVSASPTRTIGNGCGVEFAFPLCLINRSRYSCAERRRFPIFCSSSTFSEALDCKLSRWRFSSLREPDTSRSLVCTESIDSCLRRISFANCSSASARVDERSEGCTHQRWVNLGWEGMNTYLTPFHDCSLLLCLIVMHSPRQTNIG
jgi:hypothetical protein